MSPVRSGATGQLQYGRQGHSDLGRIGLVHIGLDQYLAQIGEGEQAAGGAYDLPFLSDQFKNGSGDGGTDRIVFQNDFCLIQNGSEAGDLLCCRLDCVDVRLQFRSGNVVAQCINRLL